MPMIRVDHCRDSGQSPCKAPYSAGLGQVCMHNVGPEAVHFPVQTVYGNAVGTERYLSSQAADPGKRNGPIVGYAFQAALRRPNISYKQPRLEFVILEALCQIDRLI